MAENTKIETGEANVFVVSNPDIGKRLAEWKRTVLVQDGEVWIPAGIFENEEIIFLTACYDAIPVLKYEKHIFIPLEWAIKEYCHKPEEKAQFQAMANEFLEKARQANGE